MTIIEVSKVLGLKVRTIRDWIRLGHLPAEKIGKAWNIPEDAVYSKEVQERANKSREHSRRIEEGKAMGMLARTGKDSKKSIQRTKRKKQ